MTLYSYFPLMWLTALLIGIVHSSSQMLLHGISNSWMAALFGCLAVLLVLGQLTRGKTARAEENLATLHMLTAVAPMLALYDLLQGASPSPWALLYAVVVAYGGALFYIYRYSKPQRPPQPELAPGKALASSALSGLQPLRIGSQPEINQPFELNASNKVILFIRGSWSGLCRAQVAELAALKTQLSTFNVQAVAVLPVEAANKQHWASAFADQITLCTMVSDENARNSPMGLSWLGYNAKAPLYSLIITNREGRILFSDLPENMRVRVEPEHILGVLKVVAGELNTAPATTEG